MRGPTENTSQKERIKLECNENEQEWAELKQVLDKYRQTLNIYNCFNPT